MTPNELAVIATMLRRYEYICDLYCMKPWWHPAYLDLLEIYWRSDDEQDA